MEFILDDGGRKDAGYKGFAGDCVVRAIAIANDMDYRDVYSDLFALNKENNKNPKGASPRDGGTSMKTTKAYLDSLGWEWVATMGIGTGCKVHMTESELPSGRIIVRLSKHLAAVIDGTLRDTHDCTRGGSRCVYGYWRTA